MRKGLMFIMLSVLFILSACGETDHADENKGASANAETPKEEESASSEVEITDASGETVVFETTPESIAILNSGDLDILRQLDVNITGRPTASGPVDQEIEGITEIGNPHQPNFEKIAEVNPDVLAVPLSFQQYAENISEQGTKIVYTQANSVADIMNTIEIFGDIFDKKLDAEKIIQTIQKDIEEVEKIDPVKTLLVYGAPGTYLAALPNSLSGDLLEKAGGENIASDFIQEENYPQYASLSIEKIIERNPEMIMLITHGEPEAVKVAFEEEMSENAAWKNLDAVKNGNVVVLPSHLFGTNPGTKVSEALQVMVESLSAVK